MASQIERLRVARELAYQAIQAMRAGLEADARSFAKDAASAAELFLAVRQRGLSRIYGDTYIPFKEG